MNRTYKEIVEIFGSGEQVVDEIPDFFPHRIATGAAEFLEDVGRMPWPYLPADNSFPTPMLRAVLVRSTSLEASVAWDDYGGAVILVPVGLIARTWVLSRMLLEYWEKPINMIILNSPHDDIDPNIVFLPEKYKPLFGNVEDPQEWWQKLRELNFGISNASKFDYDSFVMTLHVLYFVVFHEMQHVHFRHSEILATIRATGQEGLRDEIARGLELQADYFGAWHITQMLTGMIRDEGYDSESDHWALYTRLSYGVTMLLGAMDCTRKYVRCFRSGSYAHPIVRHQAFIIAAYRSLGGKKCEVARLFADAEKEAWKRCVQAYNALSLRIMADHESEVPRGMLMQPVQALMYGGPAGATELDNLLAQEMAVMAKANGFSRNFLRTRQI